MSELSPAAVAAVDHQGMLGDVLGQPHQLLDALWRVESARLPRYDSPAGLVVCGMGGSGVGADLAAAILGGRGRRPIRSVRDYELPPWIDAETLVLCASYSGDTEETLACFEAAGARGAPRVAVTTGGALAAAARAAGVPVIGVPSGFQPRAAIAYMIVAALECATAAGAGPSLRAELEAAAGALLTRAAEWGPEGPDDSLPKQLARRLHGRIPVVFGGGSTVPVAVRWKTQVNENAEAAAFHAALPEADHNEICAWPGDGRMLAIMLANPESPARLRLRFELTAEVVGDSELLSAEGDSQAERLLSLVLLGDLVTVYLAVLYGRDPVPVAAIERFKEGLAAAR